MRNYYKKRREYAIIKLGGVCVYCGRTNNLEFDHINKASKKFSIAKLMNFSIEEFEKELKKCQLLCSQCHDRKTVKDGGFGGGLNKKLESEEVNSIWEMLNKGKSQRKIAKIFKVSHVTIGSIKRGLNYRKHRSMVEHLT